ncbi:hypothetical protein Q7C36_002865 [Tachysurus vachellii]|uniref:Uncharacterized protein n=1 Tax=Tachysurus vachellii TaxID=175792 RepID=A0AA88NSG2_TACVA|nr:hypothetical protein Q7C36_002865 [Tachysurus vachellii]
MSRQVNKLTQFIKPSSPTDTTTEKIAQNTLTWMQKNMHTLQEHYTQVIIQLMEQIQGFSNLEWTVAIKWAKNRYKHKLKEGTLNFCKETIQNKQPSLGDTTGPTLYATAIQMASSPQAQVNHALQDSIKTSQHSSSVTLPDPSFSETEPISRSRQITVQAQVHRSEVSSELQTQYTPDRINLVNSFNTSHFRTPGNDGDTGETTMKQKGIRMMGQDKERKSQTVTRSESHLPTSATVAKPTRVSSDSSDEESLGTANIRNTPYRHINTNRKATDWSITIHKPIVFIGDSNLSRIPRVGNTNIQVDSFPGANFLHMSKLLEKLPVHPHTQKIVISIGLNNRQQQPHKTAIRQLQGLWRMAKKAFPNATVYTPIIQFSDLLPIQEQRNLEAINKYIESHGNPLCELNKLLFKVERDCIHWTGITAQRMFDCWVDQLNF